MTIETIPCEHWDMRLNFGPPNALDSNATMATLGVARFNFPSEFDSVFGSARLKLHFRGGGLPGGSSQHSNVFALLMKPTKLVYRAESIVFAWERLNSQQPDYTYFCCVNFIFHDLQMRHQRTDRDFDKHRQSDFRSASNRDLHLLTA